MGELLNYQLLRDRKQPPQESAGKAGANTSKNNIIEGFHPKILDITGKYMPP